MYKKILGMLLLISLSSCKDNNSIFRDSEQVLRISTTEDPSTLDPRLSRDLPTATVLHMLYEGLMRLNFHGEPIAAIAESVALSPDLKTYTFKLRESFWSNGDALTASHFVETWKSLLDPQFPAPNAYQFYVIKGAKAAKEGKLPPEEIGVKALDALTLVVELESPTPSFLDLVCTHFYFPYHPKSLPSQPISNGPFMIKQWKRQNELSLAKNPRYWDAKEVHLDGIVVVTLDEHTALRMYENGELEWAGSPMGTLPQDAVQTLKHQHRLEIVPAAGTQWFRFNTAKIPFDNVQMRRAFAWALNRQDIVEHVTQGNQKPAMAVVPPSLKLGNKPFFEDHALPKAWYAYQEALHELKISKDEMPAVTLCYGSSDRNHKLAQAVQQQWSKAFGIEVKLQSCESKVFLNKLSTQDYQIAIGSWFADVRDPINFLNVFKFKSNATNSTQWENSKYIALLDKSGLEQDPLERFKTLREAEALLIDEMPIAPLFFAVFNYVKNDNLLGVYFCDLGYLDFKYAFFSN